MRLHKNIFHDGQVNGCVSVVGFVSRFFNQRITRLFQHCIVTIRVAKKVFINNAKLNLFRGRGVNAIQRKIK